MSLVNIDGKIYDTEDVIRPHGKDGGLWINAPHFFPSLKATEAEAFAFMVGKWGLAQCTVCGALTVWTGQDRIIQE